GVDDGHSLPAAVRPGNAVCTRHLLRRNTARRVRESARPIWVRESDRLLLTPVGRAWLSCDERGWRRRSRVLRDVAVHESGGLVETDDTADHTGNRVRNRKSRARRAERLALVAVVAEGTAKGSGGLGDGALSFN